MSDVDLNALERRVTEKLLAALPEWDLPEDPIDPAPPVEFDMAPQLPTGWPQFPREQWITYPARRAYALLLADNAIDHGYLSEAGFLVQYGGRERIA